MFREPVSEGRLVHVEFPSYRQSISITPKATEKEKIEWKRRQNTLAARKSRKRKLEYQLYLETRVESLEHEVEVWKTRALTYEGTLRKNGIPVADFTNDT